MGGTRYPGGADRRRPFLLSITLAGVIAGLLGVSGVFAASSDRATTTGERIATGSYPEAPDVDLQIALPAGEGCGTWQEDLATPLFDVRTPADGAEVLTRAVCLRNHGPSDGVLSVLPIDLDDRDIDCTEREAEDDSTCGGDGAGELADALLVDLRECGSADPIDAATLAQLAGGPRNLVTLPGGDGVVQMCFSVSLDDDGDNRSIVRRVAQSDQVRWRFAFDLGAPGTGCQQLDDEPNNSYFLSPDIAVNQLVIGSICKHDRDIYEFDPGIDFQNRKFTLLLTYEEADGLVEVLLSPTPGTGVPATSTRSPGRYEVRTSIGLDNRPFWVTVRGTGPGPGSTPRYELRVFPTPPNAGPIGPG